MVALLEILIEPGYLIIKRVDLHIEGGCLIPKQFELLLQLYLQLHRAPTSLLILPSQRDKLLKHVDILILMLMILLIELLDLLAVLLRVQDPLKVLQQFFLGVYHDLQVGYVVGVYVPDLFGDLLACGMLLLV